MKSQRKIIIIATILSVCCIFHSCNDSGKKAEDKNLKTITQNNHPGKHKLLGKEVAKEELERYLADTNYNLFRGEVLIKDEQTLLSIAEPILFNLYSKEEIIAERPYEIYQFGDYWIMLGTMEYQKGGTFSFAINKKTCEVLGISHGK